MSSPARFANHVRYSSGRKRLFSLCLLRLLVPKAKANIEVQESNAILTVTLSRPDRLNILDLETRKEILRVLESYESSREIRSYC